MSTVSRHVYTATLVAGGQTYALDVEDGTATMDEGWSPHVQADLAISVPVLAIAALIDPRTPVRVRISMSSTHLVGGLPAASRTLDLGLRSRKIDHKTRTMRLELESDEALLRDYINLTAAVDNSAFQHQASLRQIINMVVLSKIGAALQPGTADAPFRTLSNSVNLVPNGSVEADLGGWGATACTLTRSNAWAAHGNYSMQLASPTNVDSYVLVPVTLGANGMQAGKTYTASATLRQTAALGGSSTATRSRRIVGFYVLNGTYFEVAGTVATNVAGERRLTCKMTLPAGVTEAFFRLYHGHTSGTLWWDAVRLSEGDGVTVYDTDYYDGYTPATGEYGYAWNGTPNGSPATRTALIDRSPDLLRWQPGMSAWDFIQPLFQAAGLRLFCDEERKWWLVDAGFIIPGLTTVAVGVNAIEAEDTIDRDEAEGGWYDAVHLTYKWTASDGTAQTAYDFASLAGWKKPLVLTIDRAFPGPGAAAYILKRAQGRGRQLVLSLVSRYTCEPSQPFTASLPDTPTQTGLVSAVTWNLANDEMTVKTRGLTDTPASAWVFLAPGERWTDSPAGASWTAETV